FLKGLPHLRLDPSLAAFLLILSLSVWTSVDLRKAFTPSPSKTDNSSNRWPSSTQRQSCNGADLFMRQRSVSMHPAPGAAQDEPDLVSGSLLPPASERLQHRALLLECAIHFIGGCSTGPSCSVTSRRTISSSMGDNRFLSQCVSRPFPKPWPVRSQEGFSLPGTNAQTVLDCFANPGSLWARLPRSTR